MTLTTDISLYLKPKNSEPVANHINGAENGGELSQYMASGGDQQEQIPMPVSLSESVTTAATSA